MTPYEKVRERYSFPFELRPYQVDEVNLLADFDRAGYYWEAGCVDSETEYLTPTGWRKISGYEFGLVAQYEPSDGSMTFVEPTTYVKLPCDTMVRVLGPGVDQLLSPEHRVLLYTLEGFWHYTCKASSLTMARKGTNHMLPVGMDGSGRVPLSACEVFTYPATDGFKYCFSVPSTFLVLRRNGCIFVTGNSGKTSATTHHALHAQITGKTEVWLLVMPPILTLQWDTWLKGVTDLHTGNPPTTLLYQGTPQKRRLLDLNVEFVLLSYGLLKNDFEYLHERLTRRRLGVLCDEAHAIKNIKSDTHKAVALMAEGRPFVPLTGTPITQPGDAYAYLKLIAPKLYRNQRHFNQLHVAEMDEWGNVEKWQNLDLLADNMTVQTSRILRREVRQDLPAVIYTPVNYKLDPAHLDLYRRIAEERLVEFDSGKEIDAISASALRSALQQVICNWGEFADDPDLKPAVLALIEGYLDELGSDKKLAVVANFRRTNAYLLKALAKYGVVAIYGDVTASGKQAALRRFIGDKSCRVILLQPQSAGFGIDGLQHVCSDMLFVEAPTTAPPFHQTVARLDRDGQEDIVSCRVAIASGTVQARMFRDLLANDEQANIVQRGFEDLKNSIYGK